MVWHGRQADVEGSGILWSYVRGATFICSDGSKEGLLKKKKRNYRGTARKYTVMLATCFKK